MEYDDGTHQHARFLIHKWRCHLQNYGSCSLDSPWMLCQKWWAWHEDPFWCSFKFPIHEVHAHPQLVDYGAIIILAIHMSNHRLSQLGVVFTGWLTSFPTNMMHAEIDISLSYPRALEGGAPFTIATLTYKLFK
jgi:hypothetical protein